MPDGTAGPQRESERQRKSVERRRRKASPSGVTNRNFPPIGTAAAQGSADVGRGHVTGADKKRNFLSAGYRRPVCALPTLTQSAAACQARWTNTRNCVTSPISSGFSPSRLPMRPTVGAWILVFSVRQNFGRRCSRAYKPGFRDCFARGGAPLCATLVPGAARTFSSVRLL